MTMQTVTTRKCPQQEQPAPTNPRTMMEAAAILRQIRKQEDDAFRAAHAASDGGNRAAANVHDQQAEDAGMRAWEVEMLAAYGAEIDGPAAALAALAIAAELGDNWTDSLEMAAGAPPNEVALATLLCKVMRWLEAETGLTRAELVGPQYADAAIDAFILAMPRGIREDLRKGGAL